MKDSLVVAEDPSRETDVTVTPGFNGPMPATSGWNRIDCCACGSHERQRREIPRAEARRKGRGGLVRSVAIGSWIRLGRQYPASSDRQDEGQQDISKLGRSQLEPVGRPSSRHRAILPPCTSVGNVAAMGIYAKRPARMIGQLFGDGFVLLWTVGWAIVGIFVHRVIEVLATPARETARTATRLAENFREAAAEAAKVPVAGEQMRRPLDAAAVTLGNLITSANDQVASIERLALIVGWLVFLIPVTIVVAFWLPRRIRFYRQARASQVFLDALPDLDLFALRAMAAQPLYVLAEISDDPVKAWRSGDQAVINQLAELELRRNGLQLPDTLRAVSSEASIG